MGVKASYDSWCHGAYIAVRISMEYWRRNLEATAVSREVVLKSNSSSLVRLTCLLDI